MYEIKTKVNDRNVTEYLKGVEQEKRREDSLKLLDIFNEVLGEEPKMWGDSIVGYGTYHYKYASGQEGDWMRTGFSPRKTALTLYVALWAPANDALLGQLGKYRTGKGCLYINKLEDVHIDVLKQIIRNSYDSVRQ